MSCYPWEDLGSPGDLYVRLALAIADAKDVDVLDLEPLYNTVDAEAVTRVVNRPDDAATTPSQVIVEVADCEVTVTTDQIEVVPLNSRQNTG